MNRDAIHSHERRHHRRPGIHYPLFTIHSPAFTFIEVLFAIIILGVGSIMIAGMLPVAIKQSNDTKNEIAGQAACQAGYAYLRAIATASNLYATNNSTTAYVDATSNTAGTLQSAFSSYSAAVNAALGTTDGSAGNIIPLTADVIDPRYDASSSSHTPNGPLQAFNSTIGSRINSADPRSQWIAFYGLSADSLTAKLIVVATHLNNVTGSDPTGAAIVGYSPFTESIGSGNAYANATLANGPFLMSADIADGGPLDPDTITLRQPATSAANNGLLSAESGAYVIVAHAYPYSGTYTQEADPALRNNGRVFRIGRELIEKELAGTNRVFELQPGFDLPPAGDGVDGLPNTVDDVVDNSLNAAGPASGTSTPLASASPLVWLVGGRGLLNPTQSYDMARNPYVGVAEAVAILQTPLPLSN